MELLLLCGCAFLAGLIDAVVGGGGLIQLPALLVFLPKELSASVPLVFGTNKFSSIFGTATAVAQYAPRVRVPWKTILPAAIAAFAFSVLGVKCVQAMRGDLLKPLVFVLLGAHLDTVLNIGGVTVPHRQKVKAICCHEQRPEGSQALADAGRCRT